MDLSTFRIKLFDHKQSKIIIDSIESELLPKDLRFDSLTANHTSNSFKQTHQVNSTRFSEWRLDGKFRVTRGHAH